MFHLNSLILENKRILESYGKVDSISTCTTDVGMFGELMSMERIVWMTDMTSQIPSSLFVNLTQTYIYFSYPNQQKTCNRCGDTEHDTTECKVFKKTPPQERSNVVNLDPDEYPELPTKVDQTEAAGTTLMHGRNVIIESNAHGTQADNISLTQETSHISAGNDIDLTTQAHVSNAQSELHKAKEKANNETSNTSQEISNTNDSNVTINDNESSGHNTQQENEDKHAGSKRNYSDAVKTPTPPRARRSILKSQEALKSKKSSASFITMAKDAMRTLSPQSH